MATGNFNKKLHNALVYRPIFLHLIIILKLTHLHNRLLSGSNARHLSPEDKRLIKGSLIVPTLYRHICLELLFDAKNAQRLPPKLDKCLYFGLGKFEFGQ